MVRAIFLAAGLALAAVPAQAAVMKAVVTGTLAGGTDPTGVFGPPGTNLSGRPFGFTLVDDTARATRTTTSTLDQVEGGPGSGTGTTSPVLVFAT